MTLQSSCGVTAVRAESKNCQTAAVLTSNQLIYVLPAVVQCGSQTVAHVDSSFAFSCAVERLDWFYVQSGTSCLTRFSTMSSCCLQLEMSAVIVSCCVTKTVVVFWKSDSSLL